MRFLFWWAPLSFICRSPPRQWTPWSKAVLRFTREERTPWYLQERTWAAFCLVWMLGKTDSWKSKSTLSSHSREWSYLDLLISNIEMEGRGQLTAKNENGESDKAPTQSKITIATQQWFKYAALPRRSTAGQQQSLIIPFKKSPTTKTVCQNMYFQR